MPAKPTKPRHAIAIVERLRDAVDSLSFRAPVAHVYNPLVYAWPCTRAYLERFARRDIDALFLGMNPGPFGMAQTGVPFGEVGFVRDWIGIHEPVGKPPREHPKRPIEGFECMRSEVSGQRFWGFAKERFTTPERFFQRFFVWNYCPLVFLEDSGRNLTPDKLREAERRTLFSHCDDALRALITELAPRRVVGIGRFARLCLERVVDGAIEVGEILHPSPASPLANKGWAPQVERQLTALGVDGFTTRASAARKPS
ncbi:MAG: single-stranded DNA-binding protein [Planctomycetes bacterium]|nr:single-stranded DNA-binding protein [Planctomycetota bacterium]MCC7171129.1 single-stranded DNA-binding protein [Planctomycetota bacterium]